mgnify:FL=1
MSRLDSRGQGGKMTYIIEIRNVYGRRLFCVVECQANKVGRTLCRCDSHGDAIRIAGTLNKA